MRIVMRVSEPSPRKGEDKYAVLTTLYLGGGIVVAMPDTFNQSLEKAIKQASTHAAEYLARD